MLYHSCAEGRYDECQEYSAFDRCSCRCHGAEHAAPPDDDDPEASEANW